MSVNKFCRDCQNLLYPREDKVNKILLWACHECPYQEKAESNVTYSKQLQPPSGDGTLVRDLTADVVLPCTRNERCPSCGHKEARFFKAKAGGELTPSLFFICCNSVCAHRWQERPRQHQCDFAS